MTTQTLFALIFLLLPLVASLLEQRKRKEKADEAMEELERRQAARPARPDPPAQRKPHPSQTLSDWIEEVRNQGLEDVEEDDEDEGAEVAPRGGRSVLRERDLIQTIEAPPTPSRRRTEVTTQAEAAEAARDREASAGSAYASRARPDVPAADQTVAEESDAAPEARRARRAKREGEANARFHLRLKKKEMARALVLHEVLGPPLALREDTERI